MTLLTDPCSHLLPAEVTYTSPADVSEQPSYTPSTASPAPMMDIVCRPQGSSLGTATSAVDDPGVEPEYVTFSPLPSLEGVFDGFENDLEWNKWVDIDHWHLMEGDADAHNLSLVPRGSNREVDPPNNEHSREENHHASASFSESRVASATSPADIDLEHEFISGHDQSTAVREGFQTDNLGDANVTIHSKQQFSLRPDMRFSKNVCSSRHTRYTVPASQDRSRPPNSGSSRSNNMQTNNLRLPQSSSASEFDVIICYPREKAFTQKQRRNLLKLRAPYTTDTAANIYGAGQTTTAASQMTQYCNQRSSPRHDKGIIDLERAAVSHTPFLPPGAWPEHGTPGVSGVPSSHDQFEPVGRLSPGRSDSARRTLIHTSSATSPSHTANFTDRPAAVDATRSPLSLEFSERRKGLVDCIGDDEELCFQWQLARVINASEARSGSSADIAANTSVTTVCDPSPRAPDLSRERSDAVRMGTPRPTAAKASPPSGCFLSPQVLYDAAVVSEKRGRNYDSTHNIGHLEYGKTARARTHSIDSGYGSMSQPEPSDPLDYSIKPFERAYLWALKHRRFLDDVGSMVLVELFRMHIATVYVISGLQEAMHFLILHSEDVAPCRRDAALIKQMSLRLTDLGRCEFAPQVAFFDESVGAMYDNISAMSPASHFILKTSDPPSSIALRIAMMLDEWTVAREIATLAIYEHLGTASRNHHRASTICRRTNQTVADLIAVRLQPTKDIHSSFLVEPLRQSNRDSSKLHCIQTIEDVLADMITELEPEGINRSAPTARQILELTKSLDRRNTKLCGLMQRS